MNKLPWYDKYFFEKYNKEGRCAGCSVKFDKLEENDSARLPYAGYLFCEDCHDRRMKKIPTGNKNRIILSPLDLPLPFGFT